MLLIIMYNTLLLGVAEYQPDTMVTVAGKPTNYWVNALVHITASR